MYYTYTTILHKNDDEFWDSTPRKVCSQIDIYADVQQSKGKKKDRGDKQQRFVEGETITLKGIE